MFVMKLLDVKKLSMGFNLSGGYAGAIFDINFSLEKGKTLGIVGESGCGKSVTAMSILQLLPKNAQIKSGEIYFNGENLLEKKENQMQQIRGNKIALIPQDPLTSLNPLYTIGNQILEVIELHRGLKGKKAEELAIKSLSTVKIPDADKRMNNYPHELSGGMRQRAIIAMALCCNPELIIADEPTTALDVTVQAQIMDLIKEIKTKNNTALLLITHDLGVVAENCDDVAVMYAGKIVEYTSAELLFKTPSHPYTKGLLESLPSKAETKLSQIKGRPPSITENITGCPFHPRCKYRMEICPIEEPPLKYMAQNHLCACWLYK